MPEKRSRAEEIIHKWREAGPCLLRGNHHRNLEAAESEQSHYRGRRDCGWLKVDQAMNRIRIREDSVVPDRSLAIRSCENG